MQSRSLIFLLIVAVLAGLSIFGYTKKPYAYGLDVNGGIRLIYQIDQAKLTSDQKSKLEQIQTDLVRILNGRASSSLGVVEGAVSRKGRDQVIVELPGYTNEAEAKEVMSSTAKIIVYHAKNVTTRQRTALYSQAGDETVGGAPLVLFSRSSNPSLTLTPVPLPGEELSEEDQAKAKEGYEQMIEGWTEIISGDDISGASVEVGQNGKAQPVFNFSREGGRKMEEWSRKYTNLEENIAFVLDGKVLQLAPLKKGAILSTEATIDGDFDPGYVKNLIEMVKAGSLPVELNNIGSQTVDPTIGKKALEQMVTAGLISFGTVCVFLLIYYSFPGLVAAFAMCLYALFTITALKYINATFSLAAIAALILSVGMAVDANVLVFERIKEELKGGKELRKAVSLGFSRALSAIFDSNAATLLTSIVLMVLGTGPVKGFATTLIMGVLVSFFTAFFVTRAILEGLITLGIGTNPKWYALNRAWFGEKLEDSADHKPLQVVEKSKLYFGISIGILVLGLIFVAMGGIKPNVEFQGGYEGEFKVDASQNISADNIRDGLEKGGIHGANIKFAVVEQHRVVYVTVPISPELSGGDEAAKEKIASLTGLPLEGSSFNSVGPTIAQETVQKAVMGVVISTLLIVFYLAIRFGLAVGGIKNGMRFGLCAIVALLHDVIIVIGTAGAVGLLLGWEVSALFITAMLTVIGFSVHDTIVIFDRIRENLRRVNRNEDFGQLVNRSITQSIARSINTSFVSVIPLIILIAIGTPTPELKFMCVAMLVGIAIGTYSSIFNAAPLLWMWNNAIVKRHGEEAGLIAEAASENSARMRAASQTSTPVAAPGAPQGAGQYGTIKRRKGTEAQGTHKIDDED